MVILGIPINFMFSKKTLHLLKDMISPNFAFLVVAGCWCISYFIGGLLYIPPYSLITIILSPKTIIFSHTKITKGTSYSFSLSSCFIC